MAGTPEGRVKEMIRKRLDAEFPNHWRYMPVSMGMGAHGVPDFICCVDGLFVAIEAKAPGGVPTKRQEEQIWRIKQANGVVAVVWDKASMDRVVTEIGLLLEGDGGSMRRLLG